MEGVDRMLTYKEWLLKFKDVDLPIGDLAKDVAEDPNFPNSKDRDINFDYLESRNAANVVISVFERTFDFYESDS